MPLKPIQVTRPGAQSDNKVEPGRIVEYEQHSKAILAIAVAEKQRKWLITNQHGGELELPAARLYLLPGRAPAAVATSDDRVRYLAELEQRAQQLRAQLQLEEIWQLLLGEVKEVSVNEVAEIAFNESGLQAHLAARRALLDDEVYFKRRKTGFEPRPQSVVEELKVKVRVEQEKQRRREAFVEESVRRLADPDAPLPADLQWLVEAAVFGKNGDQAKEIRDLIDKIAQRARLQVGGRLEDRAFQLLVEMKHFGPDQNLLPLRLGRPIEFSAEELAHARALLEEGRDRAASERVDARDLLCITIDGKESRDFDDALSLEQIEDGYRIGIHISDVAALIDEGSALDRTAMRRATSIYLPDELIPMLPPEASEEVLSLIAGTDRPCMSYFIETDAQFEIRSRRAVRTLVHIGKRLTYEEADDLLCEGSSDTDPVRQALLKLWEAAATSEMRRINAGALQLNRRELTPAVLPDGTIILQDENEDKPGRKLVSEMMILANETAALFAKERGIPLVFRSQEPPDVDIEQHVASIPEGPAREYHKRGVLKRSNISYEPASHFGLGVAAYVQMTSPIRRAVDLINQRQLGALLSTGAPRYDGAELSHQLALIEQGLDEAFQIQRNRTRYWLLKYLVQENIKELDAVIIKTDGPKPLAELDILFSLQPYHRMQRQADAPAIGRRIRLRIDSIDPRQDTLVLREIESEPNRSE